MKADAVLSEDGLFRFALTRTWGEADGPQAAFVMLNPSTADATVDDPTIRRCVSFARREECDGIVVVNLYAYRATKPADLIERHRDSLDIIGPNNDWVLAWVMKLARDTRGPLIAAWGVERPALEPLHAERIAKVGELAEEVGIRMQSLGTTKSGQPRHPLMLAGTTPLAPWAPPLRFVAPRRSGKSPAGVLSSS